MTWVLPAVKPIRGYILAVIAFSVGYLFILPYVFMSEPWLNWVDQVSWGAAIVAMNILDHVSMVPLIALTLIGSGLGLRDLSLLCGDPRAIANPTPLLPGLKEPNQWHRVARQFLPFFVITLSIVIGIQIRPDWNQISKALIFLPAIVLASAINAYAEEFEFRSVFLVRLESVLGPQQAILITTALFGLLHYFGAPSGPFGVVLSGFLGWVAAKSMIETRGIVWAFSLHFLADFIIYFFAAMLV